MALPGQTALGHTAKTSHPCLKEACAQSSRSRHVLLCIALFSSLIVRSALLAPSVGGSPGALMPPVLRVLDSVRALGIASITIYAAGTSCNASLLVTGRRSRCAEAIVVQTAPIECFLMIGGASLVGNRHSDPVIISGPSTLCCQGSLCHCSPVPLTLDVAFEQPGRLLRMRCSAVCLIMYLTLLLLTSLRVFLSNVCCQILRCTPVGVVLPWSNIEAGALNSARPVGQGRRRERSSKPRRRRQPNVRLVRQQLW